MPSSRELIGTAVANCYVIVSRREQTLLLGHSLCGLGFPHLTILALQRHIMPSDASLEHHDLMVANGNL